MRVAPELMTLEEVAGYLRVNEKTIYRLLSGGDIPASKIGHLWRFKATEIDDWLSRKAIKNTKSEKADILIIDDDELVGTLFEDVLKSSGYGVTTANDPFKGLELVKSRDFAMVFLDLKMPGMDGAELFKQIRQAKHDLPVTIITGFPDSDLMMKALAHGPFGVMRKPFKESDILTAVNSYMRAGSAAR
ncbi:MAG: response regulator [Dehalococcoidales bacterium]|nr:response regulator [Dehalococcoidales bacterium]